MKPNKTAHVIAISSGKGGVGKSNIAINLSIALAQSDRKVCLFDADLNLANINILLGLQPAYNLQHLILENKPINQVLTPVNSHLDIIAGASGLAEFIHFTPPQQKQLLSALKHLEQKYDYLIIDTAAGIDDTVLSFLHAAPYVLLVLTKEPTSLTDAYALLKVLKQQNYNRSVLVIVNMVNHLKMAQHIFKRFSEAVKKHLQMNIRLAGYIVLDDHVRDAVVLQQALINFKPDTDASRCIKNIASRLRLFFEKQSNLNAPLTEYYKSLINTNNPVISKQRLIKNLSYLDNDDIRDIYMYISENMGITATPTQLIGTKLAPNLERKFKNNLYAAQRQAAKLKSLFSLSN